MTQMVSVPAETITHLPPRDAWRVDQEKLERFYAPTDDRGFVLPDATIETVLGLFREDYPWPVDWSKDAPRTLRPDDHHFHWLASRYAKRAHSAHGALSDAPRRFRELPINRGIIPRQFHNVIHEVTLPPRMPKLGHMDHYLRSFEITRQLFETAQRALTAEELFMNSEEEDRITRYPHRYEDVFSAYETKKAQAIGIRAIDFMRLGDINIESFKEVHQRLGSCALMNVPNYTGIYFNQPHSIGA